MFGEDWGRWGSRNLAAGHPASHGVLGACYSFQSLIGAQHFTARTKQRQPGIPTVTQLGRGESGHVYLAALSIQSLATYHWWQVHGSSGTGDLKRVGALCCLALTCRHLTVLIFWIQTSEVSKNVSRVAGRPY